MSKLALVTGANRGLGKETAQQLEKLGYEVIAASRHGVGDIPPLDIEKPSDIDSFSQWLTQKYGRLDVLVNNAGVFLDGTVGKMPSAFSIPLDTVLKTFTINTVGAFHLCQLLIPLMKKGGYGRVVNVSSGMGALGEMEAGWPAYRISKTALNAVTRIFAAETAGTGILVNSICPGWVRTDMGGSSAHRSIEEGVDTIVWAATLDDKGPTGGFFRDRKPIAW